MSTHQGINRDALFYEVQRETGVHVTPDDPIFALVVTHDLILDSYERRWEACSRDAVKRIEQKAEQMTRTAIAVVGIAVVLFGIGIWYIT